MNLSVRDQLIKICGALNLDPRVHADNEDTETIALVVYHRVIEIKSVVRVANNLLGERND